MNRHTAQGPIYGGSHDIREHSIYLNVFIPISKQNGLAQKGGVIPFKHPQAPQGIILVCHVNSFPAPFFPLFSSLLGIITRNQINSNRKCTQESLQKSKTIRPKRLHKILFLILKIESLDRL